MRALIQRVSEAAVKIDGKNVAEINHGLLILLGVENADTEEDINWLCKKITNLRIFPDENEVMNKSIQDAKGSIIVVSQFTLHASIKKGNRPSYLKAAKPDISIPLYEKFVEILKLTSLCPVGTGKFGADMKVQLINDGPVTIWMDSKDKQ